MWFLFYLGYISANLLYLLVSYVILWVHILHRFFCPKQYIILICEPLDDTKSSISI